MQGKVIYQSDLNLAKGNQHIQIHPGVLANGIYQLKVIAGDNVMEKKIIVPE